MARPLEFDPDDTLEDIMELFRDKGYQATSIQDVVGQTGLNRASLYNTWGGKRDLFLAAIQRYQRGNHMQLIKLLRRKGAAKPALRNAIRAVAQGVLCNGCLLTNTAVEVAPHDRKVARRVNECWEWLENALTELIQRGQKNGELSTRFSARRSARYVVVAIQGLGVLGKAGYHEKELEQMISIILAALE